MSKGAKIFWKAPSGISEIVLRSDDKKMFYCLGQGDDHTELIKSLKVMLDTLNLEWSIPENLPKDIIEWSLTMDTISGPCFIRLIAMDINSRTWLWDYDSERDDNTNPTTLLAHD